MEIAGYGTELGQALFCFGFLMYVLASRRTFNQETQISEQGEAQNPGDG